MDGTGFAPLSPLTAVARAVAQCGSGIYRLGGAAHFRAPSVYDPLENRFPGTADCTGLVAYALMYRRGQWNTDAIVKDAIGAHKRFHVVPKDTPVRPSDLLVTGNLEDGPDHAGIIVGVLESFQRGNMATGLEWWRGLRVAHCSGAKQLTPDPANPGKLFGATRVENAYRWRKVENGHYSRIIRANHITNEESSMPVGPMPEMAVVPDKDAVIEDTSLGNGAALCVAGIGALIVTGIV